MSTKRSLSPALQREATRLQRELRRSFANGGMPKFLDAVFGKGVWSYDERKQLWIVPDARHDGPGREFYCINIKGDWFKTCLPAQETQ